MDSDALNVTLIQNSLHWQDAQANLEQFEILLDNLALSENSEDAKIQSDLVILPEMFNTGFTMTPESLAEPVDGLSMTWLKQQALKHKLAIAGSIAIADDGKYFNRFVWTFPDGEQVYYDKRHLFRMGNEHEHYDSGSERIIVSYRGWRILLQVCYDLRFPVFSRNNDDYDLAIYVANWPAVRRHPWRVLLQARAIENLCYVAAVNRIGVDGNGVAHSGDSLLVDFKGEVAVDHPVDKAFCETHALSMQSLLNFRRKFPAWRDADRFTLLSD